jgi:arylsulfatase A-like enzyme
VQGRRSLLFAAWALLASLPSCRSQPRKGPNVLLVVVDTLRADRLGAYGNDRGLTPFLDQLAKKGVVFRNAYAASSWTVPSVASIFTSRFPSQHRVTTFDSKLPAREVTLAEKLQDAGYDTGGFSANIRLDRTLGYGQGFRRWVPDGGWTHVKEIKVRGDRLRSDALAWLRPRAEKTPSSPPRFLYLQYLEPHGPYDPPEPYRSRFGHGAPGVDVAKANHLALTIAFKDLRADEVDVLESLYDGEVASVDAQLRALFAALEERGFLDDAVVVVTADHGEEFKEHGFMTHGHDLYNETVRVPLIVLAPGVEGGRVIEDNVSLVDVAPTILDLVGLPKQPTFEGRSLVPLMWRKSLTEWRLHAENPFPDVIIELPETGSQLDWRAHSAALVRGGVKLLIGPGRHKREAPELYDLVKDPGETRRLHWPKEIRNLRKVLRKEEKALAERANAAAETGSIGEAVEERLRALGYVE